MIKLYLFDIEGTTTDINFVHNILFPYSFKNIEPFILTHQTHPGIKKAIEDVRETVWNEEQRQLSLYQVIDRLQTWIKADRKHGALKEIQGLIWDEGYSKNDFKGHIYEDVKPFFKKILSKGKKVGIYSSGSVHAQKLIFGYSQEGDLTPLISYYFDTKTGGKRETLSYSEIARQTSLQPEEIHFFSDIPEELKAAQGARMSVTQIARDGYRPSEFQCLSSFYPFIEFI